MEISMNAETPEDARPTEALVATDVARTAGLAIAAKLDAAKARTLKLEYARLSAKHGKDSDPVRALEGRFDAHSAVIADLSDEITRSRTPTPTPQTDQFVVQGHVTDGGRPAAGLTVTAIDASGAKLSFADTDESGFYRLAFAPPATPRKAQGQKVVSAAAEAGPTVTLVVSQGGKVLLRDEVRLEAVAGKVAVRDLDLGNRASDASAPAQTDMPAGRVAKSKRKR
jgi:hypothetical protein